MGWGLRILFLSVGFYLYSIASLGGLCIVSICEAAKTVDWIQANPQSISVNQPITVTISAYVEADPALIPTSVNLIRYDSNGNVVANLGRLYDDGTHGDAVAGDNIFTTQVSFNEPAQTTIFLKASAAYKGTLKRILSQALSIPVTSAPPVAQFTPGADFPIASQAIGATGGMIEVAGTGSPLDGVRVVIPQGTLPDNTLVSVGYNNGTITPVSGIFPGIIISLDVANVKTFKKPIRITVPFQGTNMVPIPYYIDPSGKLHLAQILSIDRAAGNFTFHTFHASLYTFLLASLNALIGDSVYTYYRPWDDGFEIVNDGTFFNRDGECAGMTSFSLWYFENYKASLGNFYGKYCCQVLGTGYLGHPITGENCIATRAFISITDEWETYLPLYYQEKNLPTDADRFASICSNIIDSNYPVMIYLYHKPPPGWPSNLPNPNPNAHSVLAYGFDASDPFNAKIRVYDPNHPGQAKSILFNFLMNSFDPYGEYDGVLYIGDGSHTWEPYLNILEEAKVNFHNSAGAIINITSVTSGQSVHTSSVYLAGHIDSGEVLVTELDVFVRTKKFQVDVGMDGSFGGFVPLHWGVNHLTFSTIGLGPKFAPIMDLPNNMRTVDFTLIRPFTYRFVANWNCSRSSESSGGDNWSIWFTKEWGYYSLGTISYTVTPNGVGVYESSGYAEYTEGNIGFNLDRRCDPPSRIDFESSSTETGSGSTSEIVIDGAAWIQYYEGVEVWLDLPTLTCAGEYNHHVSGIYCWGMSANEDQTSYSGPNCSNAIGSSSTQAIATKLPGGTYRITVAPGCTGSASSVIY